MVLQRKSGFNLLELVICTGIMASGILLAVGLFASLLAGAQKAGDKSAGTMAAVSIMNQEIYGVLDNSNPQITRANFFANDSPPTAPLQGTITQNGMVFTYKLTFQTLKDPGTGVNIGSGLPGNRNKKTDIEVWWWTDQPTDTRAGYGYLRTRLTRTICETLLAPPP